MSRHVAVQRFSLSFSCSSPTLIVRVTHKEVNIHELMEYGQIGGSVEKVVSPESGAQHEHVQSLESIERLAHHGLDGGEVGHIHRQTLHLHAAQSLSFA